MENSGLKTVEAALGGKRTLLETLNVLYGLLQSIEVINGNPARYERP